MKKILVLALSVLLFLTSCSSPKTEANYAITDNVQFKEYLDELLVDSFDPSDFSINFTFIDPAEFGVERDDYDLGFTTPEDYEEYIASTKDTLKALEGFKDSELSIQQQMDKTALIDALERSLAKIKYYDFEVGTSVLGSSRALMGNIPAYLEKYELHDEVDVESLFSFIETLEASFSKYVELEKERQTRDRGYSQVELDEIIKQANILAEATKDPNYYLIELFEEALNASNIDSKDYVSKYKELINNDFSNAYLSVATGLSEIEGPAMRGLAQMPDGKDYYLSLLSYNTGSSRSIKEIEQLIARYKVQQSLIISSLASSEEEINEYFDGFITAPILSQGDGVSFIDYLNKNYTDYFPKTSGFNYELRKVHDSMEEGSSPAFYFTPQVDYTDDYKQVIFVKGDFNAEDYRTYGHEATPGHMYQFTYFMDLPSHPLLKIMTSGANAEGWANYSEQYIDAMVGVDKTQATFNKAYNTLVSIIHIEMDIGINYHGWSMSEFAQFAAENFGITDESELETIYQSFVHNPGAYPTYYLAAIYIEELKTQFFKASDSNASDVNFHEALLKYGSVGFDVIEKGFNKEFK